VASRLAVLRGDANLAQARLLRLTDRASASALTALAAESQGLETLLALETANPESVAERAFSALGRGELDAAVQVARSEPDINAHVLRYAAASEGASRELIDEALALSPDSISFATAWPSIALAEREGKPHAELDAFVQSASPLAMSVLRFAQAKVLAGNAQELDQQLLDLPPALQAYACVAALVRDAERAPRACRKLVKAGLFSSERPFFR